jgi:hypothetical protein
MSSPKEAVSKYFETASFIFYFTDNIIILVEIR